MQTILLSLGELDKKMVLFMNDVMMQVNLLAQQVGLFLRHLKAAKSLMLLSVLFVISVALN